MPGGHPFPRHRHPGGEDVVVLHGAYEDAYGDWRQGVYSIYTGPGSEHRPVTHGPDECWILTRLPQPVEFTGWRGILQRVFRRRSRCRAAVTEGRSGDGACRALLR